MKIAKGRPSQARAIARLIMEAMNYDCCRYFTGNDHTLDEFENLMTSQVERTDTLYSYLNTVVALDDDGTVAGVCVSYDGADFLRLRQPFIDEVLNRFGRDFSTMQPETQAGEMYFDSLCVDSNYRHRGIASLLMVASIGKAVALDFDAVGLIVDMGNPNAERLYIKTGFEFVNDSSWGGHEMRHLQYKL